MISHHLGSERSKRLIAVTSSFYRFLYRISLTLSCPMNLKLYPLDKQLCSLYMVSCKYIKLFAIYWWGIWIESMQANSRTYWLVYDFLISSITQNLIVNWICWLLFIILHFDRVHANIHNRSNNESNWFHNVLIDSFLMNVQSNFVHDLLFSKFLLTVHLILMLNFPLYSHFKRNFFKMIWISIFSQEARRRFICMLHKGFTIFA